MFVTMLISALALAADTPRVAPPPPLPKAPKGAPVAMPDTGPADPDAVCFINAAFATSDARKAGQDPAAFDFETLFYGAVIVRRYPDDAAFAKALGLAKDAVADKPVALFRAGCQDRYARDIQRMRVANNSSG